MLPYRALHIIKRISCTSIILRPFLRMGISLLPVACFLFLNLPFAYAGEYHAIKEKTFAKTTEYLACSQCHTMHGTQGGVSMEYGGSASGNIKLLRHASILQLCLYCHDGNNAALSPPPPDVYGVNFAAGQTNPSAGSLCAVTGQDGVTPPCSNVQISHTVDANANATAPGSSPAITFTPATGGFTCVNCHNPHGTTSYRNLRDTGTAYQGVTFMAAGEIITYSMSATPDATKYVNNLVAPGLGVAKYETSNVVFKLVPATNAGGIQGFCRSCHTLFHGAGDSVDGGTNMGGIEPTAPWKRHPTRNTNITTGANDSHADSNCWTTGTPANCAEAFTTWNRVINPDTTVNTGNAVPFCLTCHRAHGSTRHSNLIYGGAALSTKGDLDPLEAGWSSRMMRSTCQQCHNQ